MAVTHFRICGALAFTGALAACGPQGVGAGDLDGSASEKKLNAYTQAYNGLTERTLGLPEQAKMYLELSVPQKSPKSEIVIQPDYAADKLDPIKQARALPGGPPELDAAGDQVIATLTPVIARFEGLKTYYQSRKYAEDGLARGNAEDAPMKAEFKAALEATQRLDAVLSAEQAKREAITLGRLKSKGDMIGSDELQAMAKARALVELFKTPDDLKNPAVFAKGDALVAELEPLLEDGRRELAKVPKGDGHDRNTYFGDSMNDLTKVIGNYRALRSSHSESDDGIMVINYNFAVQSMNSAS